MPTPKLRALAKNENNKTFRNFIFIIRKIIRLSIKTVKISNVETASQYIPLPLKANKQTFISGFKTMFKPETIKKSFKSLCLRIIYIPVSKASVITKGKIISIT